MKSLKVKIYLQILLLILCTSLITGGASFVLSLKDVSKHLNEEVVQLSERTAQSLAFPFWNLDSMGVNEILDAQMQGANMFAVTIKEVSSIRQFVPGFRRLANGKIAPMLANEKVQTPYMHTSLIMFEGEHLGSVTVMLTDELMRTFLIKSQLFTMLSEFLILLLLALPLSFMIANSFIKPVEKVADTFREVVNSDFVHSVKPANERELRNLSDSFEEVRQKLVATFAEIQKNEKDISTTLNAITDGIIGVSTDGIIQRMNPIAEQLTGLSEESAVGKPIEEVLSLIDRNGRDSETALIKQIMTSVETKQTYTAFLRSYEDSKQFTVEIISSLILDEEGHKSGVVIVLRDITEQLRVEEELNQRRKMESLGQLSGGVAHDFNNMLGGIIGFSELLTSKVKPGSDEEGFAKHIIEAAQSAADLTAKLLAFSRKGKVISTPFSLHRSCESAISLLSRTIDKTVTIEHSFDAQFDQVVGDPSQIQNAILNLCINAKDAMPDGGSLKITSSNTTFAKRNTLKLEEGDYIVLSIADTGTGIPQELLNKVFEPFFTTKDVGKGTGLGLAAVYGSVQNHHGEVSVESEVGKGTTFTLYFPVEKDAQVSNVSSKYEEIQQFHKRVLIVDDERIIRVMLDKYISEIGGEVMQAADGIEGVALFREKHADIDIVILDMVMPNMNGDTCFYELQKIDPSVPILLASGFDKNSAISTLLEKGAAGYLHKPFNLNELWEQLYKNTQ